VKRQQQQMVSTLHTKHKVAFQQIKMAIMRFIRGQQGGAVMEWRLATAGDRQMKEIRVMRARCNFQLHRAGMVAVRDAMYRSAKGEAGVCVDVWRDKAVRARAKAEVVRALTPHKQRPRGGAEPTVQNGGGRGRQGVPSLRVTVLPDPPREEVFSPQETCLSPQDELEEAVRSMQALVERVQECEQELETTKEQLFESEIQRQQQGDINLMPTSPRSQRRYSSALLVAHSAMDELEGLEHFVNRCEDEASKKLLSGVVDVCMNALLGMMEAVQLESVERLERLEAASSHNLGRGGEISLTIGALNDRVVECGLHSPRIHMKGSDSD